MLIAGRRGDVARWPENTLEGVVSAAGQGADAIEMDVRRSADGTFYLMHDGDVARTTNGTGPLESKHDQEIDGLVIGGGMGFTGQQGLHVPRLTQALSALDGYRGLLLLDVKGGPAEHDAVASLVAGRNAWISCLNEADVAAIQDRTPTYGYPKVGADYIEANSPLDFSAFFQRVGVSPILPDWTGSEVAAMDRARRWGVKVYITNDLAAALAWSRR
jgi:glycerophosphoryl diester phosphodiesterase